MVKHSISIREISVGKRHRKNMGDLTGLAESIRKQGLLQPIGITSSNELVFGVRRLTAARDILEWTEIDCRVVNVTSLVDGEYDENEVRKDFTLSERDAIRRTIEEKLGKRQGKRTDKELPGKCPEVESPAKGEETRVFSSRKSGFSSPDEAKRVRTAVMNGTPELIASMDAGEISPSRAANIAVLPKEEQIAAIESLKQKTGGTGEKKKRKDEPRPESEAEPKSNGRPPVGVILAHEAINDLKRIPKNDPLRNRGFQIVTDWIRSNK